MEANTTQNYRIKISPNLAAILQRQITTTIADNKPTKTAWADYYGAIDISSSDPEITLDIVLELDGSQPPILSNPTVEKLTIEAVVGKEMAINGCEFSIKNDLPQLKITVAKNRGAVEKFTVVGKVIKDGIQENWICDPIMKVASSGDLIMH
ncbi:MAG TPA: hypothetical protein DCE41_21720 [Cytophagales bacterium]|nr:hypothetical protein [Cytophagales bacterium]HAA24247.1 hypothetical protein [Cytophagales bacterium]HAP58444.1 hypothetical protein [Cytophagales bacterium]